MKQRIIKIAYCSLVVIGLLLGLFLLIRPLSKISEYASYDTTNEVSLNTYGNIVKQNLYIEKERVFRIMFFLNEEKIYDNLNIQLMDSEGEIVLNNIVDKYQANAIVFEFEELEIGKNYLLKIIDLDGDDLELATTKSNDKNYVLDNDTKTLQLVTYYRENAYSYLWYPLFLFAVLYTIYPFIWRKQKYEK